MRRDALYVVGSVDVYDQGPHTVEGMYGKFRDHARHTLRNPTLFRVIMN